MPASSASLKVAPIADGVCIRVEGRGTLSESPSAAAVAEHTLGGDPNAIVVFDLSECDYLDSTFLGCLIQLFRGQSRGAPQSADASVCRFSVAAPSSKLQKILGACHLDRVLPMRAEVPALIGPWVPIPNTTVGSKDMARHIMRCHQLLAELDTPMRPAFAKIAEQLQRELAATS